ncbi:claudin-34 [Antennarius striatus]|uniref:claudin-34 n=1 Tax=Antennarius striatus TaxID=241820 RepID=UPI0035B431F9
MPYLVHTAHAQLGALWLGFVGWTLTAVALGLIQWRVWLVSDRQVISSGVAWVGIWRACFHSYILVSPGFRILHCEYISPTDTFTPPEIRTGQVLMLLSVIVGLCGNAGGVYALRNVYFGTGKTSLIRLGFTITGVLCLLGAVMSFIPLLWNLSSVVTNQTIKFPPRFKMPPAPDSQYVGCGIGVGMVGSVLMVVSGIMFCTYKLPVRPEEVQTVTNTQGGLPCPRGRDNLSFEPHEQIV